MKKVLACVIATLSFIMSPTEAASLPANGTLAPGQSVSSERGDYFLVMQPTDGHLVLYRKSDGKPVWYTGKPAGAGAWAVLQGDRNLVVYRAGAGVPSNAVWASDTDIRGTDPGAYLTVRDNGAMYLHTSTGKIYWATPVDPQAVMQYSCPPNSTTQNYPICVKPGDKYQRTMVQPACTWERAAEILTHTVNDGAVMGPCD